MLISFPLESVILLEDFEIRRRTPHIFCCGNVASPDLHITVYPFILRGIILIGIDSQNSPMAFRRQTWEKIANEWKLTDLDRQTFVCSLEELDVEIDRILAGKQKGRVIVDLVR